MLSRMTELPPQQPPQQPAFARYGAGVPTPVPPPKSKTKPWVWVLLGVLGVCCVIPAIVGVVKAVIDPDSPTTATAQQPDRPAAAVVESQAAPVVTTEAALPPPPAPAGPATSFGTGTYEVGVDIKAGTYTCTAGSRSGYWERNKNASGEFEAIIANDNIAAGAKGIVTVKAKEFFKVDRLECVIR